MAYRGDEITEVIEQIDSDLSEMFEDLSLSAKATAMALLDLLERVDDSEHTALARSYIEHLEDLKEGELP